MSTNHMQPRTHVNNLGDLPFELDYDEAWIAGRTASRQAAASDADEDDPLEPTSKPAFSSASEHSEDGASAAAAGAAKTGDPSTIGGDPAHSGSPTGDMGAVWSDGATAVADAPAATAAARADAMAPAAGPPMTPQENGSAATTAAVAATGDQRIDGVLSGVRWAGGAITYSDPDSAADYQAAYNYDGDGDGISVENEGFSQLSNTQRIAAHFALNEAIYTQPIGAGGFSVEGFTNLGITYAGTGLGTGTIRLANSTDPGTAYAFYPDNSIYGGDAWFGPSGDAPTAGNYDWHTVIHELGHSLGLKHGHEAGGVAGAMPADVDSLEYSVMTYRTFIGDNTSGYNYETWGAPQTFMMMDIAALQHMYGADYTSNSGNTVYTWNPLNGESYINGNLAIDPGGNRIFETIWDGGGTDTYDASNYTTNVNIDLRAGQHSTLSTAQLANLGGGPNGGFARGNVFNALLFGGNTASLIENASGGTGNDVLRGNEAANTLNGNAGNDQLFGEAGNDTLNGGAGNDTIDGGSGVDVMNGGAGDDTFRIFNGWTGGAGEQINGDAGVDTFDTSNASVTTTTIDLAAGTFAYSPGGSGTIALSSIENVVTGGSADSITGSASDNAVVAGGGNDTVLGASGNDSLDGGDGDDSLDGGSGTDTLIGGNGNDTLSQNFGGPNEIMNGGAGIDTGTWAYSVADSWNISLVAGTAMIGATVFAQLTQIENVIGGQLSDTITGDAGGNNLDGQAGDNSLSGGSGLDTLSGGAGNDTLLGGFATDTINGGDGDDVIRVLNGEFIDVVDGGAGTDLLDMSAELATASSVNLGTGTHTGMGGVRATTNVENFTGSQVGDSIVGSASNNVLNGVGGNDFIAAGIGNDTVDGGDGDDTLQGGFGTDTVSGGNGNDLIQVLNGEFIDVVDGGAGNDTLDMSAELATGSNINLGTGSHTGMGGTFATTNVENFFGSQVADTVAGNGLANRLEGRGGNDSLLGANGNDTIDGGLGDDTLNGQAGADSLVGGAGNDRFYVDNAGDVVQELAAGGNDIAYTIAAAWTLTAGSEVETVTLSGAGNIAATGNALANRINGNTGANTLNGAAGNDTIMGGAGNDTLDGGDNNDVLNGQTGADNMIGGAGNDLFYVDDAADTVNEAIGGGIDSVRSTAATFTLGAGAEIESLILQGAANIAGIGNEFSNKIIGNIGNNLIEGAAGADILTGGAGADLFVFGAVSDSLVGTPDRITDFTQGVDLIDLDAIDAVPATAADDAFSFIGAGAFTGSAGQLRYVAGGTTQVFGDVNGDMAADFRILLTGNFALVAADFDL